MWCLPAKLPARFFPQRPLLGGRFQGLLEVRACHTFYFFPTRVLKTPGKAWALLKWSHTGNPEPSHGVLKDLTWSSQGGTVLGLLFAKQGLTWQLPCCFMGQFLPNLGAGTQLTAAISQPNLITAACCIQDPFLHWPASSQDHRRMLRREGFAWAEGKGQERLIPAGRTHADADAHSRGCLQSKELDAGCSWLPAQQRAPARGGDKPMRRLQFG